MASLTLERASEIVSNVPDFDAAVDLFAYFEELYNPFSTELEEGRQWQKMFAEMCGFGVTTLVDAE